MVRVLSGVERHGPAAGRRRRSYTADQKRELVEATLEPGASVSVVAQRHDVNANLLFTWRRQMREGMFEGSGSGASQPTQFIPLGVVGGDAGAVSSAVEPAEPRSAKRLDRAKPRRGGCRIEIELPNGVRLHVEDAIEADALRHLIVVLKEAW